MERASSSDAGCWIDGHWGQYAVARMVDIANDYGFGKGGDRDDVELVDIALRHLASIGPSSSEDITDDEYETLSQSADDVEQWLTDNVAPTGYYFTWIDGEMFLTDDDEDDAS